MAAQKLTIQKLLFWIEKRYNVLMQGHRGVGKTAIISEAFKQAGLKFLYFSGSTMDPFIDLCGIPMKIVEPDGSSYIELIRPKQIEEGDFDAIFIDEYNRSHKKVRNATMETIQFGTVNGVPLSKKLHAQGKRPMVWVAVNPDNVDGEGEYDTDRLDEAQRDRFQIQVELEYECDDKYFVGKYGDIGKAALDFWRSLPAAERQKVSPRRVEYAINLAADGADLRDCLPHSVNPGRLQQILHVGPAEKRLNGLMNNEDEARRFLSNDNNYEYSLNTILGSDKFKRFFLPLMSPEKLSVLFIDEQQARAFISADLKKNGKVSPFCKPLLDIASAGVNLKRAKEIREEMERIGIHVAPSEVPVIYGHPLADMRAVALNENNLLQMAEQEPSQTYHRKKLWGELERSIPKNMSATAAQYALAIANKCCDSTAKFMDREMTNMVKLTNFCITVLLKGGFSLDQVKKIVNGHLRLSKYRLYKSAPSVQDIYNYLQNEKNNDGGKTKAQAKAVSV